MSLSNQIVYMLAKQRSGTHLLNRVVDSAEHIQPFGEVFHGESPELIQNFFNFRYRWFQENSNHFVPYAEHVQRLFEAYHNYLLSLRNPGTTLVIDAKYNSLHHFNHVWQPVNRRPYLFDLLEKFNIRVVHLIRRDVLDTYLSEQLSKQDDIWVVHKDENQAQVANQKIQLELDKVQIAMRHRIREIRSIQGYLSRNKQVLEVYYDELVDFTRDNDSLQKLQVFLDVTEPFTTEKIDITRVRPQNKEDKVSNWEEFSQQLANAKIQTIV